VSVTPLPHWRTVPAAARAVGVSEWFLRRQIKDGELRARRIGRVVRVLDDDLAAWMRGTQIGLPSVPVVRPDRQDARSEAEQNEPA
jgi:excisionase family DNA binding protein